MAAKKKSNNLVGELGFDTYYSELFQERWEPLKAALLQEKENSSYNEKLLKPYFLDSASVLAAAALPLENAEKILDMCAAPGGKSLVLASKMNLSATMISNERSRERKNRLVRVLDEHLPQDIRERITVTNRDASMWCKYEKETYDAILLDAPCSSERHVLQDKKYLDQWSAARIKNLSIAQWALLSSAFLCLKKGGYILYATCALSPTENDAVVKKLIKKYPTAEIMSIFNQDTVRGVAEQTEVGYHVLPDSHQGAGPLFFSLIKKN